VAASLQRNVALYPWYAAILKAHFWLPIFFLYFNAQFSLQQVLLLEAIYYAAIVVFEVPSGYFSDMAGRRKTLLIATAALTAAYLLFFVGGPYGVFVLAQIALAMGLAFNSGTDTSLHFESLHALGKGGLFDAREALVARNAFYGSAIAALAGGLIAMADLRLAYVLSVLAALTCVVLVLAMKEPDDAAGGDTTLHGFARQVGDCLRLLRRPALAWLFAFYVLMTMLNHVPYEFYQPYLRLLGEGMPLPTMSIPGISGAMSAIPMLVAAGAAAQSIRLRDRVGLGATLLCATALQTVIIATMAAVLHPAVLVLILLRTCPRAIMTAPLNAAITPQLTQSLRATYLSVQSLAGRLAFSALLVLLSLVVGDGSAEPSAGISAALQISTGIGIAGLMLLALTQGALRHAPSQPGSNAGG